MTERVIGPTGSPRRRWTMLVPLTLAIVFGLFYVAGAQAVHDDGLFELDKNATNNLNTTNIGLLQANISSTDSPIVVCEKSPAPAGTPATAPFTVLVEAEQMTVTARVAIAGGAGGCSTKASYTVTRGSNNAAHQKADDVTLMQAATKDGPDWNLVHEEVTADANDAGNDDKCIAIGLLECSYVNDGAGATIFDQGGSKDHEVIANWRHKSGSVSDKSDILNAYAAKDVDGSGRQILYFGADRQAVDGSTDAGFWFFRNEVSVNADGTFTGTHSGSLQTPGDILILTTFTQGGATNSVRVFRWVGSGGNESGSIQGPDATFGDCVPGGAGDNGCATVNDSSILVRWTHQSKGEPVGGWVPAGGLLEGGVDLTGLGLEGCFSSFLAETRASPSVPAILEDFVLGQFEACGASVVTTPKTGAGGSLTADTDNDNLDEVSIGTGSVTVKDSALLDVTGISSFDGTIAFNLCGPLAAAPANCSSGGVAISSHDADANGTYVSGAATLTSVGRYCWRADFTSTTNGVPDASDSTVESAGPPKSTGECFEVLPVTPGLDTDAGDGPIDYGQAVTDTAALTGTANKPGSAGLNATYPTINPTVAGAVAGGTITFKLYGPFSSGAPTSTECAALGLAAGFATAYPNGIQRPVTGNGTYPKTGAPENQAVVSYTPQAPGYYFWKADYNGDSPNTNASGEHNTDCRDTDEAVQVRQIPTSLNTSQSAYLNDSATISATAGGDLIGTLTFALYNNSTNCGLAGTTGRLYGPESFTISDDNDDVNGADSETRGTTNGDGADGTDSAPTDYAETGNVTRYWLVTFTPGSGSAFIGRKSVCQESTQTTFTNDSSGGTAP